MPRPYVLNQSRNSKKSSQAKHNASTSRQRRVSSPDEVTTPEMPRRPQSSKPSTSSKRLSKAMSSQHNSTALRQRSDSSSSDERTYHNNLFPITDKGHVISKKANYCVIKDKQYYGHVNGKTLFEIRRLQRSTSLLIPKASFGRVVKEINQMFSVEINQRDFQCRYTPAAVEALQEAAEIYLVQIFEASSKLTRHRNKVTLKAEDIELYLELINK